MSRGLTWVRTFAVALLATVGLSLIASASAGAATGDCGANQDGTGETTFAGLQAGLAGATSGQTFYLKNAITDGANSGGLSASVEATLDLDGCTLTVTHPGAGATAVLGTIILADSSTQHDGVLNATGGAGNASVGGGAGIGPGVEMLSGTVNATGGVGTATTGAGAGVGGAGGAPGQPGSGGGHLQVYGGILQAVGGASSASTAAAAGAGAGIGGGGGGTGAAGGDGQYIVLDVGRVTATGGASVSLLAGTGASAYKVTGGAGAGIGGGGGGYNNIGGGGASLASGVDTNPNDTLNLTAARGTTSDDTPGSGVGADDIGNGGGAVAADRDAASITVDAGTLNLSTTDVTGQLVAETGATINVAPSLALITGGGAIDGGTLNLPASSSLQTTAPLEFSEATDTLAGDLIAGDVTLQNSAGVTLAHSDAIGGTLSIDDSSSLNVPSSDTLTLGGTDSSTGLISLGGTLVGSGTLDNDGTITLGTTGAIPGNGRGGATDPNGDPELTVTDRIYQVSYSTPAGVPTPATQWVYAGDFAEGGESLPALPTVSGNSGVWESGGQTIVDTYPLTFLADANGDVTLTAVYSFAPSLSQTPTNTAPGLGDWVADAVTVAGAGTYGSPTGNVTFYVCGPLISANGCTPADGTQLGLSSLTGAAGNTATTYSTGVHVTAAGEYCFAVAYPGDAHYTAASSSDASCFTVASPSATPTPTSAATSISTPTLDTSTPMAGQPAKLSTTVSAPSGSTAPAVGQVTFFVNGTTTLCVAQVSAGRASCETSSLPAGTDTITAVYEGSTGYAVSATSGALSVQVQPSNQVVVQAVGAAKQANRLAVRLKLPNSGKLVFTVSVGKTRYATGTAKVTKAKSAKSITRSFTLKLKPASKAFRAAHHATVKAKVAITYTPAGGRAKTVTRTITLRAAAL
jgi:hypothetical protein